MVIDIKHMDPHTYGVATHELMTPRQVAEMFGVDVRTVYTWVNHGNLRRLPTPGGGRQYRLRRSEIERYLKAAEEDQPDPAWLKPYRDKVRGERAPGDNGRAS